MEKSKVDARQLDKLGHLIIPTQGKVILYVNSEGLYDLITHSQLVQNALNSKKSNKITIPVRFSDEETILVSERTWEAFIYFSVRIIAYFLANPKFGKQILNANNFNDILNIIYTNKDFSQKKDQVKAFKKAVTQTLKDYEIQSSEYLGVDLEILKNKPTHYANSLYDNYYERDFVVNALLWFSLKTKLELTELDYGSDSQNSMAKSKRYVCRG